MKTDFQHNRLLVARDEDTVTGFLSYTTYSGKALLLWMGVHPEKRQQGVGAKLIAALEEVAQKYTLHTIEVETLSDTNYEPYQHTHDFYYSQGFASVLQKPATIEGFDDMTILEKKL
jgi:GNAT superfamily N-acetyltransferase